MFIMGIKAPCLLQVSMHFGNRVYRVVALSPFAQQNHVPVFFVNRNFSDFHEHLPGFQRIFLRKIQFL